MFGLRPIEWLIAGFVVAAAAFDMGPGQNPASGLTPKRAAIYAVVILVSTVILWNLVESHRGGVR
jgi:hypothetical protein